MALSAGGLTVITMAGGFVCYKIVQKIRNKPLSSSYEVHKSKFVQTGDPEALDAMIKEVEG